MPGPNPNPNPNPNSNPNPNPYLNPNPNPNPTPNSIPIPIPIPIPVPVPSQALLQELVRVSTLDRGIIPGYPWISLSRDILGYPALLLLYCNLDTTLMSTHSQLCASSGDLLSKSSLLTVTVSINQVLDYSAHPATGTSAPDPVLQVVC